MRRQAYDPIPPPQDLTDLLSDPSGTSNWWPGVDASPGPRHSRGATRCGVCGELTDQETCCQEAVY